MIASRFRDLFSLSGIAGISCLVLASGWAVPPASGQEQTSDSKATVDYYLPLARAGNVEAQYLLGLGYERGLAEAVDRRAAARWYREAASAGHARAAYRLGLLLLRGDSVSQDTEEAIRYFEQAASSDIAEAHYYLGYMKERGLGVTGNETAALSSFVEAANLGLVPAMKAAASLYVRRSDADQDLTKAWFWLDKASDENDTDARAMKEKLEAMMPATALERAKSLTGDTGPE